MLTSGKKRVVVTLTTFALVLGFSFAQGQSTGGRFVLSKSTIDTGGGRSAGGEYALRGTIGQYDAAPAISIGNSYSLSGGFWANAQRLNLLFKDSFEAR